MNTKTIAWTTGTLTMLLTAFSFVLSFNALTDLAAEHEVSIPYLFPLTVEARVVNELMLGLYCDHEGNAHEHDPAWMIVLGTKTRSGDDPLLTLDVFK
jgi:hypothetical protein